MAKIPNTIAVKWKNKDGSKSVKYRVRINRNGLKVDELVDTEKEALELVNQARSKLGQAHIKIEQQKKEEERLIETSETSLHYLVGQYVDKYYSPDPNDTELKRRNKENKRSLYKNILNTKIRSDIEEPDFDVKVKNLTNMDVASIAEYVVAASKKIKIEKRIGSFSVFEFDSMAVDDYIKVKKAQGRKGSSILTDITAMSAFYRKMRHLTRNKKMLDLKNPCLDYDHSLLQGAIQKIPQRISDEDLRLIYKAMTETENVEMFQIVLLSLYSSMRRSEIITLTADQIFENHIHLVSTKSGKSRDVYLTKQAKDLLNSITPKEDGRLFGYTIAGFDRNWQRLRKKHGFTHIRFHSLRKESISRFVEQLAGTNSMVIAELLGISNVEKLEKDYIEPLLDKPTVETEKGLLKHIGHSNKAVTHRFYYSLPKSDK